MTYEFKFTAAQVQDLLAALAGWAADQEHEAGNAQRTGWPVQADRNRAQAHTARDLARVVRDQWNHQVA